VLKSLFTAKKPSAAAVAVELKGVVAELPRAVERADAAAVEHGRTGQREMSGMATPTAVQAARAAAQDARERADALAAAKTELDRRLTAALNADADKRAADVRRRREGLANDRRSAMIELATLAGRTAAKLDAIFGPVGAARRHAALLALAVPDAFRNADRAHDLSRIRQRAANGDLAHDALAVFDRARASEDVKNLFATEREIDADAKTALPGPKRAKALAERRAELLGRGHDPRSAA